MRMKNLLKKLHIMSEDAEGSVSSRASKSSGRSSPEGSRPGSHHGHELKPLSNLAAWLNSSSHRHTSSPPPSREVVVEPSSSTSSGGFGASMETVSSNFEGSSSGNALMDEESQIQLALEMSAKEDPEAVQIEAVKQFSLGCLAAENTPAEFLAIRYLNYNALGYDDKILDGFYDMYDNGRHSSSESAPSLLDLQSTPVSEGVYWEAILVNREIDAVLSKLEHDALLIVDMSKSITQGLPRGDAVRKLALLVVDTMGGQVGDPDNMIKAWIGLSYALKTTIGSFVLPLGSLTIGLSRHRALLFKVLADSVGIPCRLVKGQKNAGFDDVVMNFVKIDDGREYIVDLMAGPGVLIPSDAVGSHTEYEGSLSNTEYKDLDKSVGASSGSGNRSSVSGAADYPQFKASNGTHHFGNSSATTDGPAGPDEKRFLSGDLKKSAYRRELVPYEFPSRPTHPHMHGRSPSWTEGVSSPANRKMRVNDVSQYMIDAAKENPHLAQKLHDVLLESGVVAPPDLFSEVYSQKSDAPRSDIEFPIGNKIRNRKMKGLENMGCRSTEESHSLLPPLPHHDAQSKSKSPIQPERFSPFQNLGMNLAVDTKEVVGQDTSVHPEGGPAKYGMNIPVAAAAAAAAAVVASSMVAAAARSGSDSNVELPVAAAATATAAAVVATTAVVNKQYEQLNQIDRVLNDGDADGIGSESQEAGDQNHDALGSCSEGDRKSDGSIGNDSAKSDIVLGDVADCEILWEEITLGERVGFGSYGEVYRGDWRGTEVAVKRFLDQDISVESLEEFRTEVRIMKRLRHPNVVLFMGAVTRAPNFSIITEFLHRGSLYKLIHRPNNPIDERRRLRMAFDAARGMNYLHNCTPMIVHRDLKSPNLLVDRNWVVKVCDFGLSRMKHSTFLSSKSTAGTAEWMAPEVLRNEPSNEKCDVYSFGVILWELSTLQQPWCGLNPMQVVGAVGFQHRRLDIPEGMDPTVADVIRKCWQTDPQMRPSFSEIMAALKPLQRPISSSQVAKPSGSSLSIMQNRRPPSRGAESLSKDGC